MRGVYCEMSESGAPPEVALLPNAHNEPFPRRLSTLAPISTGDRADLYRRVRVERGDNPWMTALHHVLPFFGKRRAEPHVDESFIWRDFPAHPPPLVPA